MRKVRVSFEKIIEEELVFEVADDFEDTNKEWADEKVREYYSGHGGMGCDDIRIRNVK